MEDNFSNNQLLHQDSHWCRAFTLTERAQVRRSISSPRRATAVDTQLATSEMQRWRAQEPFTEDTYFAGRLAAQGLTEEDFLCCLGENADSLERRMAGVDDWWNDLLGSFSRHDPSDPLPIPEGIRQNETIGFLNLIEPFLQQALLRVRRGAEMLAATAAESPFDPHTVPVLLFASLPGQLLWGLSRTLVLELHVARMEGLLLGATTEERFHSFIERLRCHDVAQGILQEYPVMARQVVIRVGHWVSFSLEFLKRLAADWEPIRAMFAPNGDPGKLVAVQGDAGDSHCGGRSVQIVQFSSGLQVVYKPRPMGIDAHFQDLLTWLNERGDHPPFRTLNVLDRKSHGWMEFVAAKGCQSLEEIERFYRRQGAYLALLHALEACDFHSQNLIAAGEHPVLVDLESLFHPQIKPSNSQEGQGASQAAAAMTSSVMRVGLLPDRMWSNEKSVGIDMSGLGALPGQLSPMPVPRWLEGRTDEMRLIRKPVLMPESQNRPSLNGEDVDVLQHTEAILAGFSSMYRCLQEHRDALLARSGPLARFEGDQVRAILRGTSVYGALLRESFHPDVLRDGLDRDRLFDHLWGVVPSCPHLARVISAEYDDLHNGDIPFFTSRTDSNDLWTSTGGRIADFFQEPAMGRVRQRLLSMGDDDHARQKWFIRASMAVLSPMGHGAPSPSVVETKLQVSANPQRLLSAACAVGDRICELALRGEQDVSWLGLTPVTDKHWTLVPLGLDLYDGLPGVALFLAYLGSISGEARYTALARVALATMQSELKRIRSSAHMSVQMSDVQQIGGFTGWGGILYVLAHLGALWEQSSLFKEAEGIVELLPSLIERDEQFDLIAGSAGCIASLLALYRCAPSPAVVAAAAQCGNHLVSHAIQLPKGIGWLAKAIFPKPLSGFSHGAAGIAWALHELSALTSDERFSRAAAAGIAYERSLFVREQANWLDLRDLQPSANAADDAPTNFGNAWCHGAPGIGLGRMLCLKHVYDSEMQKEIDAALRTTLAQGFGGNHSLCHGDLGNLETLLEASLRMKGSRWQSEVCRLAGLILESIEQNGWLCGNPVTVEAPGLMTGLAGIGYELLRLADPARVPSVLALAPPLWKPAEAPREGNAPAAAALVS